MGFDLGIGELFGATAAAGAADAAAAGAGAAEAATTAAAGAAIPWSTIGLTAGALGTGLSAVGALENAQANKKEALYSAQVAKNNATTAAQNAQYASEAGTAATEGAQLKARATAGALTSEIAANGIDVNSGSASDVRTAQNELGQYGVNQEAQKAALQVYGFRTQGTGFSAEAGLDEARAANAGPAGALAAGGDILSGAGTFASNWLRWKQVSGTGGL
jgi:hypothetical protein